MIRGHGRTLKVRNVRFHGAGLPWDMGGFYKAEISAPMGQHGHGTWEGSRGQKFPLPWGRMVKGHGRTLEGRNIRSDGAVCGDVLIVRYADSLCCIGFCLEELSVAWLVTIWAYVRRGASFRGHYGSRSSGKSKAVRQTGTDSHAIYV